MKVAVSNGLINESLQVPLPTNELVSYNTYAPSKFAVTALTEVKTFIVEIINFKIENTLRFYDMN